MRPRRAQDVPINTPIAVVVDDEASIAAFKDFVAEASAAPVAAPADVPTSVSAAPSATPASPPAAAAVPASAASTTSVGGLVPASPLARQLASQMGVDLASIAGTGPGARFPASWALTRPEHWSTHPQLSLSPAIVCLPTTPTRAPACLRVRFRACRRACDRRGCGGGPGEGCQCACVGGWHDASCFGCSVHGLAPLQHPQGATPRLFGALRLAGSAACSPSIPRQVTAKRMVENKNTLPHYYLQM